MTKLTRDIPKEPEHEPVAWMRTMGTGSPVCSEEYLVAFPEMRSFFNVPLYTTPPQRKTLTDEQADKILETAEKVDPKYVGWVHDQRRAYVRAGYNAARGIKVDA